MITLIEEHPVLKTALGLTTLFLGLACLAFATANFVVACAYLPLVLLGGAGSVIGWHPLRRASPSTREPWSL